MKDTNLQKAKIIPLAGSQVKPPSDDYFDVLFNPAEYSHDLSNNFQEVALPGLGTPILQFVNGQTDQVSMELFFDTWTNQNGVSVRERTERFASLLRIDEELHAPPPVRFEWGDFSFQAVIESLSQRFTMFDAGGKPVRATLNVSFKQYRPLSEQFASTKPESSDRTKRRVLTADDNLWLLAHREYGDVSEWRRIARANRIANPRLVRAGTSLTLPPLE